MAGCAWQERLQAAIKMSISASSIYVFIVSELATTSIHEPCLAFIIVLNNGYLVQKRPFLTNHKGQGLHISITNMLDNY